MSPPLIHNICKSFMVKYTIYVKLECVKKGYYLMWHVLFICLVSCFIIYIGKRVWKKGNTNFIAGYGKIFTPKDEKQLAKGIGLIIMLFGFESIIFSILSLFFEGLGFYYGLLIALNFFSIFGLMIKDQVQGKS